LLTAAERGNPASAIDGRHPGGQAWSVGNRVTPLVHGVSYFAALLEALRATGAGDLVLFTDWRGDPDERLAGPGTEISRVLCEAAGRGVFVRGLIWRSHLDRLQFSAGENRHLGEEIDAAGGQCLLDMRVRPGGSHHQKFVVVRYRDRPQDDVAFAGGIDLCHSRRDDAAHLGDVQPQRMARAYGALPPWHDVQLRLQGPAVDDVQACFRERWEDPTPLSRNPARRLRDRAMPGRSSPQPLPELPAAMASAAAGTARDPALGPHLVQVLRTYPYRGRVSPLPFAPQGERSLARGYLKAIGRARALIYLEDQYLWNAEVVAAFAHALRRRPALRLVAVLPRCSDQDGRFALPPNLVGRIEAIEVLQRAGPGRVGLYSPENHDGVPVYVHAKVCVIDDVWACVGSGNLNRRSWTNDSELSCAVLDRTRDPREPRDPAGTGDGARVFARALRLQLNREHLDLPAPPDAGAPPGVTVSGEALLDPVGVFDSFAASAAALQGWYRAGCAGPRPPGRLRPYPVPTMGAGTRRWAAPVYRMLYDPDGRPGRLRRSGRF
jgi:phosphatidylserine/phosphatidylglycerophosphate/cardiolipin synthase-like enzyme